MGRKLLLSIALLAFIAMRAASQTAAPDAKVVLQRADAAMGVSKVNSIEYSATGYVTALGQNYSSALEDTWPRFELKSFIRTVDYGSMSMREERIGKTSGTWGQRTPLDDARESASSIAVGAARL